MRKLLVSFLNGSLNYHADVIAGRQFHQIRMSKYLMIDSHHQLIVKCFHGMSEKSVILHEEITSSQADTVSVVGSARTHFANSINLHVPLKKISYGYGQGESGNPGEVLE